MRRLLTVAPIALAAFVLAPSLLSAQRGGGHGGFSGHSASSSHAGFSGSAFHGGFSGSGSAPRGFSPGGFRSAPRYGFGTAPRYNFGTPGFGTPFANRFSPYTRVPFGSRGNLGPRLAGNSISGSFARSGLAYDGHRPPYRRGNRSGRNNGAPWAVWPYNYGFAGYPDFYIYPPWWDYDDSDESPDQGYAPQEPYPQDYGYPPPDQEPEYPAPPAWPASNAPQSNASSQITASPQPDELVTIVFNDGRPAEKIHNYMLTPTTLYVMDQHQSEIPVAELNLAATAKLNREAGIDFALPSPSP
jgi:hypothetical protein